MSNPAPVLFPAVLAVLKADAGVLAAFAGKPLQVYRLAPPDAPYPFLELPGAHVLDYEGDCLDGSDTELQIAAWSRTDPPGFDEAEAISVAAVAAIMAADLVIPGFRFVDALPIGTTSLLQRDGLTVQTIATIRISADPA
jgi:hypothetical protein